MPRSEGDDALRVTVYFEQLRMWFCHGYLTGLEDNVSSEDNVTSKNKAHEEQLTFLRDRLKRNEEFFRRQRDINSWWAVRLRIGIAALGALTTVVLGFKFAVPKGQLDWHDYAANFALVLSGLVTALSVWETTADYRWRWTSYGLTLTRLYGLNDALEYVVRSETGITPEQLDAIFARLQIILADTNEDWAKRLRQGGEEPAGHSRTAGP